jgi:hypothetical protein
MVAFNDSQIKRAKTGSHLLVNRRRFADIAAKLVHLDSAVLGDLALCLESAENVKCANPAERACFDILEELDHVGGRVQGSLTSKKYLRSEVWSLISFKGAPSWFITFLPVDKNHPLCLDFADSKIEFSPALRSSDERLRLIARNPVAAARFFHFVTQSFIKHILGVAFDLYQFAIPLQKYCCFISHRP